MQESIAFVQEIGLTTMGIMTGRRISLSLVVGDDGFHVLRSKLISSIFWSVFFAFRLHRPKSLVCNGADML